MPRNREELLSELTKVFGMARLTDELAGSSLRPWQMTTALVKGPKDSAWRTLGLVREDAAAANTILLIHIPGKTLNEDARRVAHLFSGLA